MMCIYFILTRCVHNIQLWLFAHDCKVWRSNSERLRALRRRGIQLLEYAKLDEEVPPNFFEAAREALHALRDELKEVYIGEVIPY